MIDNRGKITKKVTSSKKVISKRTKRKPLVTHSKKITESRPKTHKKKRRKVRKSFILFCFIVVALLVGIPVVKSIVNNHKFDNYKSINDNAKSYTEGNCIVFYPDSNSAKEYAKDMCTPYKDNEEIKAIDYSISQKGDYYLVNYDDANAYLTDKQYNLIDVNNINISDNGKIIISDYLRYTMKSKEIDEAYTSKFLNDTYYENLDLSNCKYKIRNENLNIFFPTYNQEIDVPLKYLQKEINMNLGYPDENYIRLHYVSPNRKKIALTFDDGPLWKVTNRIMNTLYKYDSVGTFFTLGWRLGSDEINLIKESISKGNEYASHTESHPNLTECSNSKIYYEVMQPYNVLKDSIGYEMKIFRPPGGMYNNNVLSQVPLKAVMWNVDSQDWRRKDMGEEEAAKEIANNVLETMKDNGVILMHDIYFNSAAAVERLVPELIDKGYQLVTVSELKESLGRTEDNPFY